MMWLIPDLLDLSVSRSLNFQLQLNVFWHFEFSAEKEVIEIIAWKHYAIAFMLVLRNSSVHDVDNQGYVE